MKKFSNKLKRINSFRKIPFGGFALLLVVIALGMLNFKSGTILTGWDNLHPEFALDVNIKRSIFAVWQEYQGLGLLGGMGHASDLVRQILLIPLVSFFPMEWVRYIATLTSLFAGSLGAYFLIKYALLPYQKHKELLAFSGGLFYLLNIGTIQTYYVAFEAFTSHYAALPWLLYGALTYIKNNSKRNFLILSLIILLATPGAYIPTLFVAFLIALSILIGGLYLLTNNKNKTLVRIFKTYGLIFAINAFWLLPFLYFTVTSSSVNLDAKMNQMATETIFLQNKEFGNFLDVATLKGFWFNNVDPDLSGNFRYMLSPWINHFKNPWVAGASITSFGVIVAGIIATIKNRRPLHLAFLFVFLFVFIMLATNTPGLEILVDAFRKLPLFGQAFRFPFTKFSILASLMYAIFFVFGIEFLAQTSSRLFKKFSTIAWTVFAILLVLIVAFPAFQGKLFYEKEQVKLPKEYLQTFEFFKNQDQNSRIANFPQHTFWGWNFYNWGYGGSGFLWYGIKQPILDRAFDVWSDELENYYYEISQAIYSNDAAKIAQVFNKYQVSYLLVDRSVYSPFAPKAVYLDETERLFSQIPGVKKVRQYGGISIYSVKLLNTPKNYIFAESKLPQVNGYLWNNDDTAYQKLGNYRTSKEPDIFYPFRSLFSYRDQKDLEFEVKEADKLFTFTSNLPKINSNTILQLPAFSEVEEFIPVEFTVQDQNGTRYLTARLLTPEVTVNNMTVTKPTASIPVFAVPFELSGTYTFNVNGYRDYEVDFTKTVSLTTYLSLKQDNYIVLTNPQAGEIQTNVIPASFISSATNTIPGQYLLTSKDSRGRLTITLPKVIDNNFGYSAKDFVSPSDCNSFRKGQVSSSVGSTVLLESTNDTICTSTILKGLAHNNSYLISLKTNNKTGKSLHFWAQNLDQNYAPVDTYLPKRKAISHIILSPMEDYGQGYSFHFENVSIGNLTTSNELSKLEVSLLPYSYLKGINIGNAFQKTNTTTTFNVAHPNESLYEVTDITGTDPFILVLSQSFDRGWKAYLPKFKIQNSKLKTLLFESFPFIFGTEIKSHVKVNNWENGWEINNQTIKQLNNQTIVIVYLPQYLEYLGLILLLSPFIFALKGFFLWLFHLYKRFNKYFELKTLTVKTKIFA